MLYNILSEKTNGVNENSLTFFIIFGVAFIVFALTLKAIFKRKKKPSYIKKNALLTATEVEYYRVISAIIGNEYLVYPQINLASVIEKKGESNFRTELFRNVDFGVFDYNFAPVLLIEINDNSHFRTDRIERDEKVLEICKSAKLPLVTFWVKDGINVDRMRLALKKYLYLK